MNKNRIRLTESQLHKVIKESVMRVLNEGRFNRYIDYENDRFIGDKEGYPYHEYVTRDGKLHKHDTRNNVSSWTTTAYGDEYPPIDYDGRYDNDEMFKKFMGQSFNQDLLDKEDKAYAIIKKLLRDSNAYFEFEQKVAKIIPYDMIADLYRGDIHVEDLDEVTIDRIVRYCEY